MDLVDILDLVADAERERDEYAALMSTVVAESDALERKYRLDRLALEDEYHRLRRLRHAADVRAAKFRRDADEACK